MKLERRTVVIEGRAYRIKCRPAPEFKTRRGQTRVPMHALQVLEQLGACELIDRTFPLVQRAIRNRVFESPTLTAFITTDLLNKITVSK